MFKLLLGLFLVGYGFLGLFNLWLQSINRLVQAKKELEQSEKELREFTKRGGKQ